MLNTPTHLSRFHPKFLSLDEALKYHLRIPCIHVPGSPGNGGLIGGAGRLRGGLGSCCWGCGGCCCCAVLDFMDVLLRLPEMDELELLLMLMGPPAFTEGEGEERKGKKERDTLL